MDYQDITYTKEEGIATITMNRPDTRNAISPAMTESIYKAVRDATEDDKVRVLVLTGTGQAFCSGADVKGMGKVPETNQPGAKTKKMDQLPLLLQRCDKPVIAALNGVAVGAGLDLACACDIRIASDKARFAELYIRRGILPAMGGTFFLPRLVGIDRACQLIWTGDMIDAKEAERIGLVTMVVPHEELENATRELADKLVKGSPLTIQRAKRAIYDGLGMDLEATLDYVTSVSKELHNPEDRKEGARAFLEKREPVFKGK